MSIGFQHGDPCRQVSGRSHVVAVVSAGIAGLSCGVNLKKQGLSYTILEASDGVGGRVRTDVQDGFLLDRGFQIFLTSYPEARAMLDYRALELKPFYAGASCVAL